MNNKIKAVLKFWIVIFIGFCLIPLGFILSKLLEHISYEIKIIICFVIYFIMWSVFIYKTTDN